MSAFFLAIWIVLLLHCVFRRRLAPLFSTDRRTKIFWLVTFVFFDPWLLLLYAVFGVALPASLPRQRWRTATVVVLALVVLTVGWVPFAPGTSPRVLERRDGKMVQTPGGTSPWPEVSLRVFRSGASSQSVTMRQPGIPNVLICRRIAILARSSHPLARHIALELQDRLGQLDFVARVEYWPEGTRPPAGEPVPDLVIDVGLSGASSMQLPFFSRFNGTVLLRSHYTPRLVATVPGKRNQPVGWKCEWEHGTNLGATIFGYESAAARYAGLASNVAEGAALVGLLQEAAARRGAVSTVPASMEGSFSPAELPMFFQGLSGWRRVFSGPWLLQHHVGVWEFEASGETQEVLNGIQRELEADGWKEHRSVARGTGRFLEKDQSRLHVFHPRDVSPVRIPMAFNPDTGELENAPQPPPREFPLQRYIVQCAVGFSLDELDTVIDDVLKSPISPELLAGFEPVVPRSRLGELRERLVARSGLSPQVHLALSRLAGRLDEASTAREELLKAGVLARVFWIDADRDLESRAKELGLEGVPEFPSDPAIYRELGFIEVAADSTGLEKEIGLNEPVAVFNDRGDGWEEAGYEARFGFAYLRVIGRADETGSWRGEYGGASSGSGGMSKGSFTVNERSSYATSLPLAGGRCVLDVTPLANERFRVEIEVNSG